MDTKGIAAVAKSIRSLSIDAIQKAKSGHPGLPLGCAELAAILYGEVLKHNPADSKWIAAFIVFTFAVCRIVLPGIWAYASSALGVQAAPVGNAPEESMWQMILFGVILSPVLEELLFRKDIFSLLKMRFSRSWTVWLSSLLFAAVHGYSVEGFVSCLVAGGLFAILMARTGKLLPCILAHVLCNLESLYYNTAKSGNALIVNLNEHTTYNVYIFAAGLLVMALSGVYLYRRNQHCK